MLRVLRGGGTTGAVALIAIAGGWGWSYFFVVVVFCFSSPSSLALTVTHPTAAKTQVPPFRETAGLKKFPTVCSLNSCREPWLDYASPRASLPPSSSSPAHLPLYPHHPKTPHGGDFSQCEPTASSPQNPQGCPEGPRGPRGAAQRFPAQAGS